jgi:tetratricopeptide (TPR) repeat protein
MAGAASTDGHIDLRRAYILIDLERWQEAQAALDEALNKQGLNERRTGEAYLLRGVVRFNLENFDGASTDWAKAIGYASSKESARQWINHLREKS